MYYKILNIQGSVIETGNTNDIPNGAVEINYTEYMDILEGRIYVPTQTAEELADIAIGLKWKAVEEYEAGLTVTLSNGNKYAANKNARLNIMQERDSLRAIGIDASEPWMEEWGTFNTNAVELQEVLDKSLSLLRVYRNSIFEV